MDRQIGHKDGQIETVGDRVIEGWTDRDSGGTESLILFYFYFKWFYFISSKQNDSVPPQVLLTR